MSYREAKIGRFTLKGETLTAHIAGGKGQEEPQAVVGLVEIEDIGEFVGLTIDEGGEGRMIFMVAEDARLIAGQLEAYAARLEGTVS